MRIIFILFDARFRLRAGHLRFDLLFLIVDYHQVLYFANLPWHKTCSSHPLAAVADLRVYACPRHVACAVIRTFRGAYSPPPSARSPFLLRGRQKS